MYFKFLNFATPNSDNMNIQRKQYRELSNRYSPTVKIINGDDDAYHKELATERTKFSVFNLKSIKSRIEKLK